MINSRDNKRLAKSAQRVHHRRDTVTPRLRASAEARQGKMEGEALVRAILRRRAYVNVHTKRNPKGEIRGQITKVED